VPAADCKDTILPFDEETLRYLYPSSGAYRESFEAVSEALVERGFLLPEDAAKLIEAARQRRIPYEP
jgi:hypothetical protein